MKEQNLSKLKKNNRTPQIKESGKAGLTKQVRDYLKFAEKIYPIYAVRNHQGLGSDLGRPDWEVGFSILIYESYTLPKSKDYLIERELHEKIYLELKSPKWRGKLNKYQQAHKDRIERAGGEYHIITSIDQLDNIFKDRGYDRITIG